jgi:hypothetical protein
LPDLRFLLLTANNQKLSPFFFPVFQFSVTHNISFFFELQAAGKEQA